MKMKCLNPNCGEIRRITRKEQGQASRPKCWGCGGGQFEEVVKKQEEPELQTASSAQDEVPEPKVEKF